MSPRVLAGLVSVLAVGLFAAATSDWLVVTSPGPIVDGLRLPDESMTLVNGAQDAPLGLVAALLALATAALLVIHGAVASRGGPALLTRLLVTLAALSVPVAAAAAWSQVGSQRVVTMGGAAARSTAAGRLVVPIGLLVLLVASLVWRRPRRSAEAGAGSPDTSRYTVESVRREEVHPDDVDDWDAAVIEDTAHAAGEEDAR